MKPALMVMFACLLALADDAASLPWEKTVRSQMTDTDATLRQNDPVAQLLAEDQGLSAKERLAYIKRCEKAAARYPESAFRTTLCKKIGDVYFDVDQLRYARKWSRWYTKAAKADPFLLKETPIGFRLQEYSNIAKRRNLLSCVFVIYGLVLLIIGVRTIRCRCSFDIRYFFKRCAVFLGIFIVMACAAFVIDLQIFSKSPDTIVERKPLIKPASSLVRPFIPLSVMDPSAQARAAIILLLGFLPLLLAIYYASFKKQYSRILLSIIVAAFCSSLWLHFTLVAGFDEYLKPRITVTGSRVLFSGEPEKLLLQDPARALRVNPGLLKSGNEDLVKFIDKHYPEGFPNERQKKP
jgi:hypothetical protein